MADEIIQSLGFDVAPALAALAKLDAALQSVGNSMVKLGGSIGVYNTKVPAKSPVDPAAMAHAHNMVDNFTLSWKTMARVVTTQAIVRAMSMLRDVITDATRSNIEFAKSLNLIRTIEQTQSVQQLGAAIRELAIATNTPIQDVSAGLYDVISQQIKGAAEQTEVLRTSLEFAKLTSSSAADSVQLLTSTMHAFGKEASDTELIAAKFFRTIDIGNITAPDFISTFGRVAPMAAAVGVSLDEAQAAFAALTQKGVRAHEASTQIAASFSALIKPSVAMKKAMEEIGTPTAELAFKTYGYMGALQKLIETTDGSDRSLGKLFVNVRALREVMGLATDGGKKFNDALEQIQKTSAGELGRLFTEQMATDAERVTKAINEFKITLMSTVGTFSLWLGSALALPGVATAAAYAVTGLAAALAVATVAFGAVSIVWAGFELSTLLSAKATALMTSRLFVATTTTDAYTGAVIRNNVVLGKYALTIRSVGAAFLTMGSLALAAYMGGRMIASKIDAERQASTQAIIDETNAVMSNIEESERRRLEAAKKTDDAIVKSALLALAEIQKAYTANTEIVKDNFTDMSNGYKSAMDSIIEIHKQASADLKRISDTADREIISARKNTVQMIGELSDLQFRREIENSNDLASRAFSRAQKLMRDASAALSTAQTPEAAEAARDMFERARQFAEESKSAGANAMEQLRAQRLIEDVLKNQIKATQQYQVVQKQVSDAAKAAELAEKNRIRDLTQLQIEFLKKIQPFDKKGSPLDKSQIEQNLKDARRLLGEFFQKGFAEGRALDLSSMISFDSMQQRVTESLDRVAATVDVQNLAVAPTALENLRQQIIKGTGLIEIAVRLVPDKTLLGKDFGTLQGQEILTRVGEVIPQQAEVADSARQTSSAIDTTSKRITELQRGLDASLNKQDSIISKAADFQRAIGQSIATTLVDPKRAATQSLSEETSAISEIQQKLRDAAADATLTQSKYLELTAKIHSDFQRLKTGFAEENWRNITDALNNQLKEIAALREAQAKTDPVQSEAATKAAESRMQAIKSATDEAAKALNNLKTKTDGAKTSLNGLKGPASIDTSAINGVAGAANNVTASANAATNALYAMASAAQTALSMATAAAGVQTAATGGMMYYDQGGFTPRGTDTIPAMLSPGEFVMNARSTKKFYSQLVAMNAGNTPSFRSQGGEGNVTVGDININGASQPRETAREVIRSIRRELRRGTSILN